MKKSLSFVIVLISSFYMISCQSLYRRPDLKTRTSEVGKRTSSPPQSINSQYTVENPNVAQDDNSIDDDKGHESDVNQGTEIKRPRTIPEVPKIGIILGPGGSRVYGQIGVLQELQKNKIPIHSVAGIELGALVGSLYAWRGSVNDVEWQMFKIKEEDLFKKNILTGKKTTDVTSLSPILKTAFNNLKSEDLKKHFSCPALNLQNSQIYMMNKGFLEQMLPFCLPYPPLFKPYKNNIGSTRDLKVVADYLRSQGANYIVFVNVLGGDAFKKPIYDENSTENLLWAELSSDLTKQLRFVDFTINLNLDNYSIVDFSQRRELMQKGSEQSYKSIQSLAQKLGL